MNVCLIARYSLCMYTFATDFIMEKYWKSEMYVLWIDLSMWVYFCDRLYYRKA